MPIAPALLFAASSALPCSAAPDLAADLSLLGNVRQQVCQQLSSRYKNISLSLISIGTVPEKALAHGLAALNVELGSMRAGRLPVSIMWSAPAAKKQQGVMWFRVNAMTSVWRTRHDLKAEQVISGTDVELVQLDVAAEPKTAAEPISSPVGMAVVRPVRKHQVLASDDLSEPALVKRNDRVRVMLNQAGLQLLARGTALTTGWRKNDVVQIQVSGAEATITGKVASVGEVYVEI